LGIFVVGNLQQLQQLQRLLQGDIFVDFAAKAIHHEGKARYSLVKVHAISLA
jgi:hypothetical protein